MIGVSYNLVDWDNGQAQIEQVGSPVPNADGTTETVTVRLKTSIDEVSGGRKFLRLNLTP